MFLGKVVLKICSKFTGGHPCRIRPTLVWGGGRKGGGGGEGVLLNQLTNKSRYSSQMLKLQNIIILIRFGICELLNTI